jgi:hypothetical protein
MAYVIPQFNLTVTLWRVSGVGGDYTAWDLKFFANLSPGRRENEVLNTSANFNTFKHFMMLLCPALTDIRAAWNLLSPDLVEVPKASGRFYDVVWVDDVGKGFANEYRLAFIQYRSAFLPPSGSVNFPTSTTVPMP